MILAYMIFASKTNLDDGLKFVRERRQIANPNMNFMAQLIWFYKRLHNDQLENLPVMPRVFLVSSHEPEDPFRISCRLLMENLYQGQKSKLLDTRALFIVQGPSSLPLYIWMGNNVLPANKQPYLDSAQRYIKRL